MNIEKATQIAIKAIDTLTAIGQEVTKNDVLKKMQEIDESVKDGYAVGRAISNLVYEGYLELTGKRGNANLYNRVK